MKFLNTVMNLINVFSRYGLKDTWRISRFLLKNSKHDISTLRLNCLPKHEIHIRICDRDVFREVWMRGVYDYLIPFEVKTVLDCGANIGLTTLLFRKRFPSARIISVEPENSNFISLQKNTKEDPNIFCVKAGIWRHDGHIQSLHEGTNVFRVVDADGESSLKAISIPSIMKKYKLSEIDLLKMDVEGAEKEIFTQDVEPWLPKVKVLLIEFHDAIKPGCSQAVFSKLAQFNFALSGDYINTESFLSPTLIYKNNTLCFFRQDIPLRK